MKFIYSGILVKDLDRSLKFYAEELGMELLFRAKIKETGGEVAVLKTKGSAQVLELNWYPDAREYSEGDRLDHLGFEVHDADREYRRLVRDGAASARKPFDEGRWRLAYVKDPDGAWIELGHKLRKHSWKLKKRKN